MSNNKFIKKILPFYYSALTSFPYIERDFDALTQYEILQAIIDKLNEIIPVTNEISEGIADVVTAKLDEMIEDGTLAELINETLFNRLKIFYVPEDFDGVGDGETDCTTAFDEACKAMTSGNIKILFIPKGTYKLKNTIAIPEGCSIIGTGAESVIYYDETDTSFGVALTNGGSNVKIANLTVNHRTQGEIIFSAQAGAIGISTLNANGETQAPFARQNVHNIEVSNIYCESRYPIQIEPDSAHTIENVKIENIYAPDGLVSWGGQGTITNMSYKEIVCDVFRGGAGNGTIINGTVENVYCKHLRASDTNITYKNVVVDGSASSYYLDRTVCVYLKSNNPMYHCKIIGGTSILHGINLYAISSAESNYGEYVFENCEFTNLSNLANNTVGTQVGCMFFNNCKVTDCTIADSIKYVVKGGIMPFKRPVKNYPKFYYNRAYSGGNEFISTEHTLVYNYSTIIGNTAQLRLLITLNESFTNGDVIFTFDREQPASGVNFFGFACDTDNLTGRQCALSVDSTGNVTLANSFGLSRVMIDCTVTLEHKWQVD